MNCATTNGGALLMDLGCSKSGKKVATGRLRYRDLEIPPTVTL